MPQLETGDNGQPIYQDGKFVLVLDDKTETPFDALGAYSTFGKIHEERDAFRARPRRWRSEAGKFGRTPRRARGEAIDLLGKAGRSTRRS